MMLRAIILLSLSVLTACQTLPPDAFRLAESALAVREMQTREYDSISDAAILSASTDVLQDMGYAIDEIEEPLGVLSASKRADATTGIQALGSLAMDSVRCVFSLMLACDGNNYSKLDDVQDIRLTLISRPQLGDKDNVIVRITIQRVIWDKKGRLSEQQTVTDSDVYASFFNKMSQAVFLERELT
jgi:hypothetical protein